MRRPARQPRQSMRLHHRRSMNKAVEHMLPTADLARRTHRASKAPRHSSAALPCFEGTWQKFRGNEARGKELLDIAAKAAFDVIDSHKFRTFRSRRPRRKRLQIHVHTRGYARKTPQDSRKTRTKNTSSNDAFDATLKTSGRNITTEVLANAQLVSAKFAQMYLCTDGLPIDKSPLFKGYENNAG